MDPEFRTLFEAAPDAMIVVDEGGVVLLANEQAEAAFGYNASEIIGNSVEMLLPDRFRPHHEDHRRTSSKAPSPAS